MARKVSFNTFRIVCVRDDDVLDDDEFYMSILVDGVDTRNVSEEVKAEAALFLVTMFKELNEQSMRICYGKADNTK